MFSHEAERLEQKAKGDLERQKIADEAEAEKARKKLLELQASRYDKSKLVRINRNFVLMTK